VTFGKMARNKLRVRLGTYTMHVCVCARVCVYVCVCVCVFVCVCLYVCVRININTCIHTFAGGGKSFEFLEYRKGLSVDDFRIHHTCVT